jgi:hypothetical protein
MNDDVIFGSGVENDGFNLPPAGVNLPLSDHCSAIAALENKHVVARIKKVVQVLKMEGNIFVHQVYH